MISFGRTLLAETRTIPHVLPASFKDVAFNAMSADAEHGRRGFTGEFPFGGETRDVD